MPKPDSAVLGSGFIDGMSDTLDELGPVDYIVVEFPGNKFNGDIAPALGDLVDRDLVRVLDLVFVTKEADGRIEGFELEDIDEGIAGEIEKLEIDIAHVLSEDDVVSLAGATRARQLAALLVWENRWAAPFASAVRHSGGQLVASGRIPVQALIGALEDGRRRSLRCHLPPVVSHAAGSSDPRPSLAPRPSSEPRPSCPDGVARRSDRRGDRRRTTRSRRRPRAAR